MMSSIDSSSSDESDPSDDSTPCGAMKDPGRAGKTWQCPFRGVESDDDEDGVLEVYTEASESTSLESCKAALPALATKGLHLQASMVQSSQHSDLHEPSYVSPSREDASDVEQIDVERKHDQSTTRELRFPNVSVAILEEPSPNREQICASLVEMGFPKANVLAFINSCVTGDDEFTNSLVDEFLQWQQLYAKIVQDIVDVHQQRAQWAKVIAIKELKWQHNEALQTLKQFEEHKLCQACHKSQRDMVMLPCGHVFACERCSNQVEVCYVCGKSVAQRVRAHF